MKLRINGIVPIALGVLSLALLAWLTLVLVEAHRTRYLTLAAGAPEGESYILGQALKTVVERHYPKIRITLTETGGTVQNLEMLENGKAELATAQADVTPGPSAQVVAVLYDDTFQMLVPAVSPVQSFADLRGRRIALAQSGGQFQSFLAVAEHFGLHREEFHFVGSNDASADEALREGEADAEFRVRALGNSSILELVKSGKVRFLPIEHAAGMRIEHPAFDPTIIPEGAYMGSPPVPPRDLPTVAIHRLLLARSTANPAAVQAIAQVLMERRGELQDEIPQRLSEVRLLLAQVTRPDTAAGLGPPVHPGALNFYNRDKPSFIQANADYLGLMLTLVLMVGSWIWELRQWIEKQQKDAADRYSERAMALMSSAEEAASLAALEEVWRALGGLLKEAVRDLDADKLSEESFNSFRSILQIAMEVAREKRALLRTSNAANAAAW